MFLDMQSRPKFIKPPMPFKNWFIMQSVSFRKGDLLIEGKVYY